MNRILLAALLLGLTPTMPGQAHPTGQPVPPPIVRVTVTPAPAATASIVDVTVTITNPPTSGYRLTLDYGEGRTAIDDWYDDGDDCTTDDGEEMSRDILHDYRMAGTWLVRAVLTLNCGLGAADPQFAGTATAVVQPGKTPSNGPIRPSVSVVPPDEDDYPPWPPPTGTPLEVFYVTPEWTFESRGRFRLQATDYDGYLTSVVIRWGDGTKDTTLRYPLTDCVEPALKQFWPRSELYRDFKHAFKRGRTYVTTVTVSTSGCDGKDSQTAVTRLRHRPFP